MKKIEILKNQNIFFHLNQNKEYMRKKEEEKNGTSIACISICAKLSENSTPYSCSVDRNKRKSHAIQVEVNANIIPVV